MSSEFKQTKFQWQRYLDARHVWQMALCLMVAIALSSVSGIASAREVRVGIYENSPKIFTDARHEPAGILVDLLREVAAREGWQLSFVRCEWEKCLRELEAGNLDLLPDVAYSDERARRFSFHQVPVLYSWSQIYRHQDVSIISPLDLNGKRIALLGQGIQAKGLSAMTQSFGVNARVIPTATLEEAFRLVEQGDADAAVASYYFGSRNAPRFHLVETPIVFQPARLFYASAKGRNTDVLSAIDRTLAVWTRDSGSVYFKTLKRWAEPVAPSVIPRYILITLLAGVGLTMVLLLNAFVMRKKIGRRTQQLADNNAKLQTAMEALQESKTRLEAALASMTDAVCISDVDGHLIEFNEAFAMFYRFRNKAECAKRLSEYPDLLDVFMDSGESAQLSMWAVSRALRGETVKHAEYTLRRKDTGETWVGSYSFAPIRDKDGVIAGAVVVARDITEQKQAEARIRNLAQFDQLTGLPNRTQLLDRFTFALSLAQRSGENLAVMFLDLDHFKDINDTLGHSVGDALLTETSKRLKSALREEDTVSRSGGDEFIFILPGTDENGAALVATKLLEAVSVPFHIEQHELIVTSSIGIAIYPGDGENLEILSKNADAAMFQAKQAGRNRFRFFAQEMQAHSARNLQLSNALRYALARDQLQLHYQPQVSMGQGHLVGVEALLRWTHPELGKVPPDEFIPIAEANGLIIPIGEWVIRSAAKQMKAWIERGLPSMVMAVNLSAMQFRHPGLLESVSGILAEVGLPPEYLELELTEAVAMDDPEAAVTIMDKLYEQGIRLSIDDFGTGYSSLGYLKRFKVNKLKIDRSFIRDISEDPDDKAIVTAIINLASALGIHTLAEGVETAAQLAFLRLQGCDEVQGYYFSKPLPADEFEAFANKSPMPD